MRNIKRQIQAKHELCDYMGLEKNMPASEVATIVLHRYKNKVLTDIDVTDKRKALALIEVVCRNIKSMKTLYATS